MEEIEKTFAKQVDFEIREQEVATMVINGVPQENQVVKQVVITCPNCGNIITSFQANIPLVEIYKELAKAGSVDLGFCSKCGQKLFCDKSIVSEQNNEDA